MKRQFVSRHFASSSVESREEETVSKDLLACKDLIFKSVTQADVHVAGNAAGWRRIKEQSEEC